jgi:hypothetical protein
LQLGEGFNESILGACRHLFDGGQEQGSAGRGVDQVGAGLQQRTRFDRQRGRRSLYERTGGASTRRVYTAREMLHVCRGRCGNQRCHGATRGDILVFNGVRRGLGSSCRLH